MSDMIGGPRGSGAWSFTSFRRTLERLQGDTVRIQTNDSAFYGTLACVESTFVTLARGSTPPRVQLTYIPIRHINAVSAK